jgi:hypothetical protein
MTDALRSDRPGDAPDRERDARIEELLLSGLDHYFGGQHELAINVWTRVLFLDRGHARARAYIERARGAVSEKQREGDELVHSGAAALNRGDRLAARQLLTAAIERGASSEEALALLNRLERLEAATVPERALPRVAPAGHTRTHRASRAHDPRLAWIAAGIVAGVLIATVAGAYVWIVADPFDFDATRSTAPLLQDDPLPVPAACEIRLARARDLFQKGRLLEASAQLEAGDPDERHRASMDELRIAIQRQLLAQHAPGGAEAVAGKPSAPPRTPSGTPRQ